LAADGAGVGAEGAAGAEALVGDELADVVVCTGARSGSSGGGIFLGGTAGAPDGAPSTSTSMVPARQRHDENGGGDRERER
jgi:hypothetical protein